ncbi:TlpA family protein disulfide reductase [Chitinophaga pollutisoli]|uniref:TlpA family protein disulfide reductase n=1 Tax=Chitinophaga pollutisoli TaxID=3133966 RepID=UPI0038577A7E
MVILDFWGTFCGTCIENFPHMSELKSQFGADIEVILVNPFESKAKVEKWIKVQDSIRGEKACCQKILPS